MAGMFRVGSDVYEKEDGHLGLSTIAKSNVSITVDGILFDYVAKEGCARSMRRDESAQHSPTRVL